MNKIILLAFLCFSVAAYSQTSATTADGKKVILKSNGTWAYADCDALLKTETYSNGQVMTSAKDILKISNDGGKTGVNIALVRGTGSVIINFSAFGNDIECVDDDAPIAIEFTDNSKLSLKHMGKLNCKGDFSIFLGEALQNMDALEALKAKKLKKITIEYSKTNAGKVSTYTRETSFTAAEAEKILKIIQCLDNV